MSDPTEFRVCNRCGATKPLDAFGLASWCTGGRRSTCRECRDTRGTLIVAEKACSVCGITKPISEFHRYRSALDGHRNKCKSCIKVDKAESHLRNRQANIARSKASYEANRAARIADAIAWKKANPDKVREYARTYVERHPEAVRANARRSVAKRRAQKLGTTVGPIDTDALWTGRCGICHNHLDAALEWPNPLSKSVDHIVPLSRGGAHEQPNLQWAHLVCNMKKGAKTP